MRGACRRQRVGCVAPSETAVTRTRLKPPPADGCRYLTKESICNTYDSLARTLSTDNSPNPSAATYRDGARRVSLPRLISLYVPSSVSFVVPYESTARERSLILFNKLNNYLCFASGKELRRLMNFDSVNTRWEEDLAHIVAL